VLDSLQNTNDKPHNYNLVGVKRVDCFGFLLILQVVDSYGGGVVCLRYGMGLWCALGL
jgi:hypothetical protein